MGMVRSGFAYEAIAREERLSRERIRQIVAQSLDVEDRATRVDYVRLQMARLEPALRVAARGVENGKLSAINALLWVLDKLDNTERWPNRLTRTGCPRTFDRENQRCRRAGAASGDARANPQRPGGQHAYRAQGEAPAALKKLKTDLGWRKS